LAGVLATYREDLREILQGDLGDSDSGFRHVVRHDGRAEQLPIADRRKVYVENDAVVYGEAHQLQNLPSRLQTSSIISYHTVHHHRSDRAAFRAR